MPPVDINPSISQLISWHLPVTEEEEIEEKRCLGKERVIKWKNSAERLHHVMEDKNYSNEYIDGSWSVLQGALDILEKNARGCMGQSAFTELGIRPIGLSGGSRTVTEMASVIANEDLHQTQN